MTIPVKHPEDDSARFGCRPNLAEGAGSLSIGLKLMKATMTPAIESTCILSAQNRFFARIKFLMEIVSKKTKNGRYACWVKHCNGWYWTDEFETVDEAEAAARSWIFWYENASSNRASSVYYILAIPETWIGPPSNAHRYSGLSVKIGVAKMFANDSKI